MELLRINQQNAETLYTYWNEVGKEIPYFHETSYKSFLKSLFEDKFNGMQILLENHIYVAIDNGKVYGFIQYGKPGFHYENWEVIRKPNIGIIRNLYFEKVEVGNQLVALALDYFQEKELTELYAFYHAMGMSCNGNHGKLHEKFEHIEKLLYSNGFEIEHENIYYTKHIDEVGSSSVYRVEFSEEENNSQGISLHYEDRKIGSSQVKFIDQLTGTKKEKVLFLVWIGLEKDMIGTGAGTAFLSEITNRYQAEGYKHIHTDTSIDNTVAQKYYERNGFKNTGKSRSYIRK